MVDGREQVRFLVNGVPGGRGCPTCRHVGAGDTLASFAFFRLARGNGWVVVVRPAAFFGMLMVSDRDEGYGERTESDAR